MRVVRCVYCRSHRSGLVDTARQWLLVGSLPHYLEIQISSAARRYASLQHNRRGRMTKVAKDLGELLLRAPFFRHCLQQYGPANKKHLIIWASLRFLLGRHLQTTLSIGYYMGFSAEFTTEPFFFTQCSQRSPNGEPLVLVRLLFNCGPTLCLWIEG